MTQKEQTRLQVLNSLVADHMTIEQAAILMGVSTRHTRRILAAYRREGAAALAHGNRGRRPANATPDSVIAEVVHLARTRYRGANHTHLGELLGEREGIEIGRPTLRRILVGAGLPSPRRRRPPAHRIRRQRMPREGMLVQLDGSHHRWLEGRGPQFTLLLAVDDATGCVASALFCREETTHDYFVLLEELIRRWGIPLSLYTDRHAVFTPRIDAKPKSSGDTQFTRAMDELGIELILARSPQAKGRVERMAGTFQDRLVTELRLAGASTIAEANMVLREFLPRFNEQFRVPARESNEAYRALDADIHLDRIFCYRHSRKVARDNTLRYRWHTLQLAPDDRRASYAGTRVEVIEGLDGSLRVLHDGRIIPSQEAPPRPATLRNVTPRTNVPDRPLNGVVHHRRNSGPSSNGEANVSGNGVHETATRARHKPNRRQRAWWNAVHDANNRGVSVRGITRELGMSRNTVRRYLAAEGPEMVGTLVRPRSQQPATMRHNMNGHNR